MLVLYKRRDKCTNAYTQELCSVFIFLYVYTNFNFFCACTIDVNKKHRTIVGCLYASAQCMLVVALKKISGICFLYICEIPYVHIIYLYIKFSISLSIADYLEYVFVLSFACYGWCGFYFWMSNLFIMIFIYCCHLRFAVAFNRCALFISVCVINIATSHLSWFFFIIMVFL